MVYQTLQRIENSLLKWIPVCGCKDADCARTIILVSTLLCCFTTASAAPTSAERQAIYKYIFFQRKLSPAPYAIPTNARDIDCR